MSVSEEVMMDPIDKVRWAYGLTTVPERRDDLLPRTLESLAKAGFDKPRLFVDGGSVEAYKSFGLPLTVREPRLQVSGNWILALYELWIRNPEADRFAVFQDDLQASANLRKYLSRCPYEESFDSSRQRRVGVYWNLYTIPMNEEIVPVRDGKKVEGWHAAAPETGKGAVALVFSRQAVIALLSAYHLAARFSDIREGWCRIDGGIVTAMLQQGWHEYIHYPSLVQHIGMRSAKAGKDHTPMLGHPDTYAHSRCWRGETFDCLGLLVDKPQAVVLE
jgi:hypothetical protein